jgi:hypothetical protein
MQITLKNISYNSRLSEETSCFTATVYVDGKMAGSASNRGHGGPTSVTPRELESKINAYGKTLPEIVTRHMLPREEEPFTYQQTAETIINDLLSNHLTLREMKRALKSKVLFTKADGKIYETKNLDPKNIDALGNDPAKTAEKLQAVKILNFLPESEALEIYSAP